MSVSRSTNDQSIQPQYLSVREVAAALSISHDSALRILKQHSETINVALGSKRCALRIPRQALERLLKDRRINPRPAEDPYQPAPKQAPTVKPALAMAQAEMKARMLTRKGRAA